MRCASVSSTSRAVGAVARHWRLNNLHPAHADIVSIRRHRRRPRTGRRRPFANDYGRRFLHQRCSLSTSSTTSSSPPDSFHGLSLPPEKEEDGARTNRAPKIQEAEVVKSEQDRSYTREWIKEATRAELSGHSAVPPAGGEAGAGEDGEAGAAGPYERRVRRLKEALRRHESIDRRQTLEYARSCVTMGEMYYRLGDMDRSQELCMEILDELLSGDRADADSGVRLTIAQGMHLLGAVHARCGEYEDSSQFYEEALERKRELLTKDSASDDAGPCGEDGASMVYRYELGKTYNGLAALDVMKGGDAHCERAMPFFREAERCFLHHLETDQTKHDDDGDCDEYNPLQPAGSPSIRISKEDIQKMTPRHVESLIDVRSNIGELLRQRGEHKDSIEVFRSALDTATMALENKLEQAKATSEIETVAASPMENSSWEEEGSTIVDLLVKIADGLASAKNFDEAAETYERALASHVAFRRRGGEGDGAARVRTNPAATTALPAIITSTTKVNFDLATATTMEAAVRNNLAHALAQIGQDGLALEQYTASLAIKRRIGGESHVETAHTLMSMGALLGGPLRDFTKALNCFKEASHIYRINLEELSGHDDGERSFFDDEISAEIDGHIKNALKNISMIEAALLKDRDGTSK